MEIDQLRFFLGQIFSLLSAFSVVFSTFRRKKHQILFWQLADSLFIALSDFSLGAYSAMIVNLIGIARNSLMIKEKYTKPVMILFLVLVVGCGILFNNLNWVGWIAILAAAEITVGIYFATTARRLMWVLLINMMLWFIHDVMIQSYPVVIIEIITSISLIVHLIRWRKAQKRKKRKKKK